MDKSLLINMTEEMHNKLRKESYENNISMNEIVRMSIEEYFNRKDDKNVI